MADLDILKTLVFFFFAGGALIFATLSILMPRIIYSLISAVIVFYFVGCLFFLLGADYNAVVQISVYGVAIPIILVLALMFTSRKKENQINITSSPRLYFSFLALGLLFIGLTYLISTSLSLSSNSNWILQKQTLEINKYQMFRALAEGLFTNYVVAFEVFSLLLLIIVVGLSMLELKGENSNE